MRVFHFSQNVYEALPAKHHTRRIWEELADGCEQYHVIASSGRLAYSHSIEGNLHLHLLPSIGKRGWSFFLTSWLGLILGLWYRPDRVVAQCPANGGIAASALGWLVQAPVLIEIHGAHYFAPFSGAWRHRLTSFLYRVLTRISFAGATRIRSLSSDMTANVSLVYGAEIAKKVVEVGNRVDLSVFGNCKKSYHIGDQVVLVSVGAFTENKGHLTLIEEVLPKYPEVILILVGRGKLTEAYWASASRLNVAARLRVVYARTHAEVADILASSDIYVHPSQSEGVPRAILEAMAVGLPVVATRVGFLGGVVDEDRNIMLVPPMNADLLGARIGQLIESEPLRRRLGTAAAETIRARFEWNRVFDQYRSLIRGMRRGL